MSRLPHFTSFLIHKIQCDKIQHQDTEITALQKITKKAKKETTETSYVHTTQIHNFISRILYIYIYIYIYIERERERERERDPPTALRDTRIYTHTQKPHTKHTYRFFFFHGAKAPSGSGRPHYRGHRIIHHSR